MLIDKVELSLLLALDIVIKSRSSVGILTVNPLLETSLLRLYRGNSMLNKQINDFLWNGFLYITLKFKWHQEMVVLKIVVYLE